MRVSEVPPLVYRKRCIYNCVTICRNSTPVISNTVDFWILETEFFSCVTDRFIVEKSAVDVKIDVVHIKF